MAQLRRSKGGGDEGRSSWLKKATGYKRKKKAKIVVSHPDVTGCVYPVVSIFELEGAHKWHWLRDFNLGEEEEFVIKLQEKYGYEIVEDGRSGYNKALQKDGNRAR